MDQPATSTRVTATCTGSSRGKGGSARAVAGFFLALAAAGTAAAAEDGADLQPAGWKSQELVFEYHGFTTRYSCDGLQEKLRRVLLALGARNDLRVTRYGCSAAPDRPDPLPSLSIRMATLQPQPAGPDALEARWQEVDLAEAADLGAGDCELAEQIVKTLLPHFTMRELKADTRCVPHQLSAGRLLFRLEALKAATR